MSQIPKHLWLNGRVCALGEARISPFDQGLTLGDGVYETLVDRGSGPVALGRHWQRLHHACGTLGMAVPDEQTLRDAFRDVMAANGMKAARLRFTITRGEGVFGSSSTSEPTMIAVATALREWPATERVCIVPWKRNASGALTGIKSISYGENGRAMAYAREHGAGEAVFANTRDELCEGSGSNVFIVRDDVVLTPPLDSGCLPGVMREMVIECCRASGIKVDERRLSIDEFRHAPEAFLTSSTRDVHPVSHIDGRVLPQAPGGLTRRVQAALETSGLAR